jgi:hypothetical protein
MVARALRTFAICQTAKALAALSDGDQTRPSSAGRNVISEKCQDSICVIFVQDLQKKLYFYRVESDLNN